MSTCLTYYSLIVTAQAGNLKERNKEKKGIKHAHDPIDLQCTCT